MSDGRAIITIKGPDSRNRAHHWINRAVPGTRVEFKAAKRTLPQNDRMWAMLTDIATQLRWHGKRLTTNDWKLVFLDALEREVRTVPNLDGTGFVSLSQSSSDLGIEEMTNLIELLFAFGAQHAVVWSNEKNRAEAAA